MPTCHILPLVVHVGVGAVVECPSQFAVSLPHSMLAQPESTQVVLVSDTIASLVAGQAQLFILEDCLDLHAGEITIQRECILDRTKHCLAETDVFELSRDENHREQGACMHIRRDALYLEIATKAGICQP